MSDSNGTTLAMAVGGAAVGAAAGALLVSLLAGPRGAPAPVATPTADLKKISILLKEDNTGVCHASFVDSNDKMGALVNDGEPGVKFDVYNEDCDQPQVFRLKEKRGTSGRRPLLVGCRFHAQVPGDVPMGSSINPLPLCTFPFEQQFKGHYEYIVQLCTKDTGNVSCTDQDPEIEVKRR